MENIVTKSELARELGCSRSTLTRLCSRGAPALRDGRLNRLEFLQYLKSFSSGVRGGWFAGSQRGLDLNARAVAVLKGLPAKAPTESKRGRQHQEAIPDPDPGDTEAALLSAMLAEPDAGESSGEGADPEEDVLVLNKAEFRKLHGEIREKAFRDGMLHLMNSLRRPGNVLEIANLALGYGCTPSVAYSIAQGYDLLLVLWVVEEKDGPVVEYGDEPDWKEWAKRAGVDGDIEAWEREAKRLFNRWVKGPAEPSGKAKPRERRKRKAGPEK